MKAGTLRGYITAAAMAVLAHGAFTAAHARSLPLTCAVTPSLPMESGTHAKKTLGATNNLRRATGSAVLAQGMPVYLSGRVLDENCVPIADAVVEITQTDSNGIYPTEAPAKADSHFSGWGRTVTSNDGGYQFVTVYPGHYGGTGAHIHFRVAHPDFEPLHTTMYFADDVQNANDKRLHTIPQSKRSRLVATVESYDIQDPAAGKMVQFDIILRGTNLYRSY